MCALLFYEQINFPQRNAAWRMICVHSQNSNQGQATPEETDKFG